MQLSRRQQDILRVVVEAHLKTGRPVASKTISEMPGFDWSPSTVRAELAALEAAGFLTHPHTSAGRVPTDRGVRFHTDELLAGPVAGTARVAAIRLSPSRYEISEVIREAAASLAATTDLLALATAPPASVARVHRVEVLQLQPSVVMVVMIASDGQVSRRVFRFEAAVDAGLVDWASSYLNERLEGLPFGARTTADRLRDPGMGASEAWFIESISPAFAESPAESDGDLYLEGTSRLLAARDGTVTDAEAVIEALEHRREVIQALRASVNRHPAFCWVGSEGQGPELGRVSVVGAGYGLGYRNLGAVGVVGPVRMDYATAIASVRAAATELSRFFESVYEN